jgi:hypothetical protein
LIDPAQVAKESKTIIKMPTKSLSFLTTAGLLLIACTGPAGTAPSGMTPTNTVGAITNATVQPETTLKTLEVSDTNAPPVTSLPIPNPTPTLVAPPFTPAAMHIDLTLAPGETFASPPATAILGSTSPSQPVVTNLNPSKDNTFYQDSSGSTSNGAGQYVFVGVSNNGEIRRAAIAFDVAAAIPDGSTIINVDLTLQMSRSQAAAETIQLHKILGNWGQGSSDASGNEGTGTTATSGDATWLHRTFDSTRWQIPGGDFSPIISASAQVGGTDTYKWLSTTQLIDDVQLWLDFPSENFGWLLKGNENNIQTAKRFASMEAGIPENRPLLTIGFIPGK